MFAAKAAFILMVAFAPMAGAQERSTTDRDDLNQATVREHLVREMINTAGENLWLAVTSGTVRRGDFSLGPKETHTGHVLVIGGNADISGRLVGNLVALGGDVVVHPGGAVSGDIVTLGGAVRNQGGEIGGEVLQASILAGDSEVRVFHPESAAPTARVSTPSGEVTSQSSPLSRVLERVTGAIGVFIALLGLGIALGFFARANLEVVSDTVSHAFGRSFLVGFIGQILLLPTFGIVVVGLVLSVIGILLLPLVAVAYLLLMVMGITGGYLAVAHAIGETYERRRQTTNWVRPANSYRYLVQGLGALTSLWIVWALFSWVAVAHLVIWTVAFVVTWLVATAGFGAALLSRAGMRKHFTGQFSPPEAR